MLSMEGSLWLSPYEDGSVVPANPGPPKVVSAFYLAISGSRAVDITGPGNCYIASNDRTGRILTAFVKHGPGVGIAGLRHFKQIVIDPQPLARNIAGG